MIALETLERRGPLGLLRFHAHRNPDIGVEDVSVFRSLLHVVRLRDVRIGHIAEVAFRSCQREIELQGLCGIDP